MRRPIPRLMTACAACLAVAAAWMFLPGHQATAVAFNQVADAIVTAKTARFRMEINIAGQPKVQCQAFYLSPGRFRQELATAGIPMINVVDSTTGKMVTLNPSEKKATVMNLKGMPKDRADATDQFELLKDLLTKNREAKSDAYERIGEKEIDGKKAIGFRLDSPAVMITMWGDSATGRPIRIETVMNGAARNEVAMTNFEFNVELDKSLFDTTPPADYKVQSFDIDASKPTEQDLIQSLKVTCDLSEGEFLEGLDMQAMQKSMTKSLIARGKAPSDEEMSALMKQGIAIGRGFNFATTLPESADAHYAGKGIKRDEKDKPVFWYKPEGAKAYRVIYADLSVKDVEAAPKVPGAMRIEKASRTTSSAAKAIEPAKVVEPGRAVEPVKVVEPAKRDEPAQLLKVAPVQSVKPPLKVELQTVPPPEAPKSP